MADDRKDSEEAEARQLTRAVVDLAAEFPDVPYEVIVRTLQQATERYDTATVRTYLPILVTKDVRALLRNAAFGPEVPAQVGRVTLDAPPLELAGPLM